MDSEYDELWRRMFENTPQEAQGLDPQSGLLGNPQNIGQSNAQEALSNIQQQNQVNTQEMQQMGQDAIQQGMQASQGLQAQRQAQMDAASQAVTQAADNRKQLFGSLLKNYIMGRLF